jgi:hypothetical protein
MSRAAYPAEDIYSWFHKHSSSHGLFCIESSNLNLTTTVRSNLDHYRCISLDLIDKQCQIQTAAKC